MPILKRQKHEIWQTMLLMEVDPSEFEWSRSKDASSTWWGRLAHTDNTTFFKLREHSSVRALQFSPDIDAVYSPFLPAHSWEEVPVAVETWCAAIRSEREAIDPWEARDALAGLIKEQVSDGTDNSLYTPTEQTSILNMLSALEQQVGSSLDASRIESEELRLYVARQFQYLREDLPTHGRREWRRRFWDFMLGIATNVTVMAGPAAASAVVDLAQHSMRALSG